MFGLGFGELLVVLLLALLLFGPKKLPELATQLGRAIRSLRRATSELGDRLEVDEATKAPLRELRAAIRDEPAAAQQQHAAAETRVAARRPRPEGSEANAPLPAAPDPNAPPQGDGQK